MQKGNLFLFWMFMTTSREWNPKWNFPLNWPKWAMPPMLGTSRTWLTKLWTIEKGRLCVANSRWILRLRRVRLMFWKELSCLVRSFKSTGSIRHSMSEWWSRKRGSWRTVHSLLLTGRLTRIRWSTVWEERTDLIRRRRGMLRMLGRSKLSKKRTLQLIIRARNSNRCQLELRLGKGKLKKMRIGNRMRYYLNYY